MKPDILLTNIGQVATLAGNSERPKTGEEFKELSIIENGAIAIESGTIVAVGTTNDVLSQITEEPDLPPIEFPNMLAIPGFVDSHTHLAFGGSRENDFAMKLQGKTYLEILEAGGGILNTLRTTRKATREELCSNAFSYAESMLSQGTTTLEGKSGYGLNTENEIQMLRAYQDLQSKISTDIVTTFMGAHAIPPEFEGRPEDYVDLIINEMIPAVSGENLAEFCDIFCEQNVFSIAQSRRLLTSAKNLGLGIKLHADEIVPTGGSELAAELEAISADHLLQASAEGIRQMAAAGVVATLLPATAFSLKEPYAGGRSMIDSNCAVALATDFNPGSCFTESIPLIFALATLYMDITTEEAVTALTINAAAAIDRAKTIGSLDVGKYGDLVVLEYPSYKFIPYHIGISTVGQVVKKGNLVFDKEKGGVTYC